jgi:hypothetical protein
MNENTFGKIVIIDQDVKFIGKGEDPKDNMEFQAWEKAYKEAITEKTRKRI